MPEGAPTSALGARSGAPSGLRPSSFVMCNPPVEVQFITSAGCLNYPYRTPVGGRAEAGPDRACEKLSSGGFDAALDRAVVDRRLAPLGVREANLGLSPRQRLALTLVLLAGIRLHDRDHAAIRLSDNLRVTTHRLGKILRNPAGFEH